MIPRDGILWGHHYRHYENGRLYSPSYRAKGVGSLAPGQYIVYHDVETGDAYLREDSSWRDDVEHAGERVPRFAYVGPAPAEWVTRLGGTVADDER